MTNTISRADAVAAVRCVPPGTTCRGDAIIAAINALPEVAVTDDVNALKAALAQAEGIIADLRAGIQA